MYRCEQCDVVSKPNLSSNKLVVQTRKQTYRYTPEEGDPFETTGFEIVKELTVCEDCFNRANQAVESVLSELNTAQ